MQAPKGSLVALVTPLKLNGDVDYGSLENLIEWHVEEGTNGIVSVGTTGESATLSVIEHLEVITKTVKYVNGRIPVIAGTGNNSTRDSILLTQKARDAGADFSLLVSPYYNKPNQEGLEFGVASGRIKYSFSKLNSDFKYSKFSCLLRIKPSSFPICANAHAACISVILRL